MKPYELDKIILTTKYSKRVIIDKIYSRPYMPWKIDSEVKIILNKSNADITKFMKTKIWKFEEDEN